MKTSRRPLLWYNTADHNVYEWSGWIYDGDTNDTEDEIWAFSPDDQENIKWNPNPAPATNDNHLTSSFGSSTVFTQTEFYSLGGTLIPPRIDSIDYLPDVAIQRFLSFNFSGNLWTNESSANFSQSGFSVLGEAAFIPNFGQEGLLVFLGGDSPPTNTYQYQGAGALLNMTTIPLYDIHTNVWFHQTVTGDIPPGRTGLCMVGAPAADNSSFEM